MAQRFRKFPDQRSFLVGEARARSGTAPTEGRTSRCPCVRRCQHARPEAPVDPSTPAPQHGTHRGVRQGEESTRTGWGWQPEHERLKKKYLVPTSCIGNITHYVCNPLNKCAPCHHCRNGAKPPEMGENDQMIKMIVKLYKIDQN